MRRLAPLFAASVLVSLGCDEPPPERIPWYVNGSAAQSAAPKPTGSAAATKPKAEPKTGFARLDRTTFNRVAVQLNQPLYWAKDTNNDGVVAPDEVVSLLFYPTEGAWVEGGKFTDAFKKTYEDMVKAKAAPAPTGPDAERQKKLIGELDAASSFLVRTSLDGLSETDIKFVEHMVQASKLIDDLYMVQTGVAKIADKVAPDAASQSVFRRNRGPLCKTPVHEKDKDCTAAPGVTDVPVDVYPEALQGEADFCKKIEGDKALTTPFAVVRDVDGKLTAQGYGKAYTDHVKKIAEELRAAATDMTDDKEAALVTYLNEAATAFESNKWQPADEAWAKMNSLNSKWYLRIGPDETYWEPCSLKAGFHMSFARINGSSPDLHNKVSPLIQEMESSLATLIGAPYKARPVSFHLPDMIDIVINAGDDRDAIGATGGQSLPNWGPVANEGRGRTVVMTNINSDPDSLVVRRAKASSILTADAMKDYVDEGRPGVFGTFLHEAAHNLGPSHEYKVDGKKDDESFGGDLASMLEELKAQSGSYYFLYMLQDKGVFTEADVRRAIVDNVVWSVGHVSRGMYAPNGKRKPYSQLAAIHLGFFIDEGALIWNPEAKAANGDKGAFSVDFTKMKDASIKLMKVVATIKAKGDKAGAIALADQHVAETSKVPHAIIQERMLKYPSASFVYAIDFPAKAGQ